MQDEWLIVVYSCLVVDNYSGYLDMLVSLIKRKEAVCLQYKYRGMKIILKSIQINIESLDRLGSFHFEPTYTKVYFILVHSNVYFIFYYAHMFTQVEMFKLSAYKKQEVLIAFN